MGRAGGGARVPGGGRGAGSGSGLGDSPVSGALICRHLSIPAFVGYALTYAPWRAVPLPVAFAVVVISASVVSAAVLTSALLPARCGADAFLLLLLLGQLLLLLGQLLLLLLLLRRLLPLHPLPLHQLPLCLLPLRPLPVRLAALAPAAHAPAAPAPAYLRGGKSCPFLTDRNRKTCKGPRRCTLQPNLHRICIFGRNWACKNPTNISWICLLGSCRSNWGSAEDIFCADLAAGCSDIYWTCKDPTKPICTLQPSKFTRIDVVTHCCTLSRCARTRQTPDCALPGRPVSHVTLCPTHRRLRRRIPRVLLLDDLLLPDRQR